MLLSATYSAEHRECTSNYIAESAYVCWPALGDAVVGSSIDAIEGCVQRLIDNNSNLHVHLPAGAYASSRRR